jgi:hypothetical protein
MMRRCMALLALSGAAAFACDFPTEPPMWEQTWQVSGETIELSVAELLPAGVTLNADSTAFVVEAPGASVSFRLGDMCTECSLANETPVPTKPAFGDTVGTTTSLPADLVSATLAGGAFGATMAHNFGFDPLRPSSDPTAERGYIEIVVTSNGNIVADTLIHGDDQAFPAGTQLSPVLQIQPVAVTNNLDIEVRIYSPEGDATVISASDSLGITIAPSTIEISEATVTASAITLDPTTTEMDFGGMEEDGPVLERIRSGALLFEVHNPFSVSGTLDLQFQLATGTIHRTLAINEGTYSARLDFTGDELRQILGSETVSIVTSGAVAATGGTITVTPTQKLILDNSFELVVLVGGLDGEE